MFKVDKSSTYYPLTELMHLIDALYPTEQQENEMKLPDKAKYEEYDTAIRALYEGKKIEVDYGIGFMEFRSMAGGLPPFNPEYKYRVKPTEIKVEYHLALCKRSDGVYYVRALQTYQATPPDFFSWIDNGETKSVVVEE